MSNSFQINFNGGKSTGIKQYSYSQSNLSHTAKEAKMNTASTEIDYGETENFDYENYLVETEQKEVQVSPQEIEELRGKLKEYGFTDRDIERLISGEVTVEGLYEEILTDEKGERRRRLYEIEYLKSFGTEHKTKEELESSIETVTREIEKLREEQGSFQFTEEEAALGIINGLAIYGGDLDEIIENYIVGWEYIDENGVKQYEYSYNPNYMGSVENGEIIFKNLFGYDLIVRDSSNSSYNVEGIAFDICLSRLAEECNNDVNQIDFKKYDDGEESIGLSAFGFDSIVGEYFKQHGIVLESNVKNHSNGYSLSNDLLAMALDSKDRFQILSASHFDMELLRGRELGASLDGALANAETEGALAKNVGGHAMLVTNIDENMNLIVSSWSRKYKFLANSLAAYKDNRTTPHATVWNIKFSIPQAN